MNSKTDQEVASDSRFWRSLQEFEDDPAFLEAVRNEFPAAADLLPDEASRRQFLHRMGASLALAGLSGCRLQQPEEKIVPPVETRAHATPGETRVFATSMVVPGGAIGLLATCRDGRPIKLEGNPQHPASLGATDVFAQASILELYDPDRSRVVRRNGRISNWADFAAALKSQIDARRNGTGLHILTGATTSPTLLAQLQHVMEKFPNAVWHEFEPFGAENARAGAGPAFGRALSPRYHVHRADAIFALDADFLDSGPAKVRLAREFAGRRRVPASGRGKFNRLYVAESTPTLTGAAADHRLALKPGQVAALLADVAKRLGVDIEARDDSVVPVEWVASVTAALQKAGNNALVIAGPAQPPEVHALAYAVNAKLGSLGRTVEFLEPVDRPDGVNPKSIGDLTDAMQRGAVETLVMLGVNPVYSAPPDLKFAETLRRVPFAVHLGLFQDETARLCEWHVPRTHFLEAWSDARSDDGTAGIVQPCVAPLHNGKSAHDLLNAILGERCSAQETVRQTWKRRLGEDGFERRWKRALHDGVIEGTAFKPVGVTQRDNFKLTLPPSVKRGKDAVEIVFRPDPTLHDGRYANNGWLQELPKPFTKLTWGNAALLSPATAKAHGLQDGDVVELAANGSTIAIPVMRLPGQPDGVVTLHAGHGRRNAGRNGDGIGVDVSPLQTAKSLWRATGTLRATRQHADLATTQNHFLMENRDLVRAGTWAAFQQSPRHPPFMAAGERHGDDSGDLPTLYPELKRERPQWGMTINLGSCIGCNACVVACQAENNIPVVGPDQVRRRREMHWIRIDTFFSGAPEGVGPRSSPVHHQPVPCMHCEHAPCEVVCPVAATTHSDDGLNEMTYNRCIGTRYCSNNCPYKVRRFNFLDYRKDVKQSPVLQLVQNPEVTVRSRGVMEKCTYCVQRISAARIQASMENREIRDGEVVTACQAVCPTQAIVFGDVADPHSQVAKQKSHPLNYGLLTELNTRPRTTYLADVNNPDPALTPRGDA